MLNEQCSFMYAYELNWRSGIKTLLQNPFLKKTSAKKCWHFSRKIPIKIPFMVQMICQLLLRYKCCEVFFYTFYICVHCTLAYNVNNEYICFLICVSYIAITLNRLWIINSSTTMHLLEHPNIYFPLPVVHCAGNKSYRCHVSRFHLYYMIPCIIVTDSCKISVLMSPASLNVKVGSGWAFCYCCCQYYLRWEECAIECRPVLDIQISNVIHDIIVTFD